MTGDQSQLFILLICVFGFLVWGHFRYDLVAFIALLVALVLELVPREDAFSGFGHPATIVVALVLLSSSNQLVLVLHVYSLDSCMYLTS